MPGLEHSQTQIGTLTHGLLPDQDLLKLRFLMSHLRKNSGRNKVIRKKWIYLEKNTLHRPGYGIVSFYGVE